MKHLENSPFNLENTESYLQWRERKLAKAQTKQNKQIIPLEMTPPPPLDLSSNDCSNSDTPVEQKVSYLINPILEECEQNNYCIYKLKQHESFDRAETRQLIHKLAFQCNLFSLNHNICADEDSLSAICQSEHNGQHGYIPYSNKALSWHTDGYYNLPKNTIYSMLLHCFNPAQQGGESAFMDHEIAYILLRDENPDWIKALSQTKALTIPANELQGKIIRGEQTGPVFTISQQGHLHMRYSARKKNIIWQQDNCTLDAIAFLSDIFANDSEYIIKHSLKAGEGIISRNVLHRRNAFVDNELTENRRLLFRGRFYDELPNAN